MEQLLHVLLDALRRHAVALRQFRYDGLDVQRLAIIEGLEHHRACGVQVVHPVGSQDEQIVLWSDEDVVTGAFYETAGELLQPIVHGSQ